MKRGTHTHPVESLVVIHDGVCGNPESYACTSSQSLARILMRFPARFGLLDVCECGCSVWGAIVRREEVPAIVEAIEEEIGEDAIVDQAVMDAEWHEEQYDHLAKVSASRN